MRRWLVLAALLGSLGGQASPSAAQSWAFGQMSLRPRLELAEADFNELLPGRNARSAGAVRAGRAIAPAAFWHRYLVRDLPVVWELRLPSGTRPEDLDVRYELYSFDGRPDRLGHVSDPTSTVPVSLVPGEPRVVGSDRGLDLVQGGLRLELEVDSVRRAGRYRGTLTVTVNQL